MKKGFIIYLAIFTVSVFLAGLAGVIVVLALGEKKILFNNIKSIQSRYAAESGVEDILLRIKNSDLPAGSYVFNFNGNSADISLSENMGGIRTIISEGNSSSRIRKVRVVYAIDADHVSFNYGAQIGEGGMIMGNNSRVKGNVFSNGNISGGGEIENSVVVSGNGNKISGINVGENALVHSCENADIGGTLTYVSEGTVTNCSSAFMKTQSEEIDSEPLPISANRLDEWKSEAASGGILSSDYVCEGACYLGPVQIGWLDAPKNLIVSNNARLIIRGTVYVSGDISFGNGSVIELDSSYGSLSGIILASGKITANNGSSLRGSGYAGSYILVLSD
ncbi:MAG: hypothetical protein Q8N69_02525, partial [bacterium]|nr:hypothetical protein [bacterium]